MHQIASKRRFHKQFVGGKQNRVVGQISPLFF